MSGGGNSTRTGSPLGRALARLGGPVRGVLARLGSLAWFVTQVFRHALRIKPHHVRPIWEMTRLQIRFTALEALPLVGFTALLLGGITLLQVYGSWTELGAEGFLSRLLAQLVIRELGPLLVGVIIISRSGTAIATEMASMKLSGELNTLVVTGVNPYQFVILPRILGGVVSFFCLMVFFDTVALLGGFILAFLLKPISFNAFLLALGASIDGRALGITLTKASVFGATIPLLCLQAGLRVRQSRTEIPQAVTRAAVRSFVILLLSGAILSAVFYA